MGFLNGSGTYNALGSNSSCLLLLEGQLGRSSSARSVNNSGCGCTVSACGGLGKCRRAGHAGDLWSDEPLASGPHNIIMPLEGIDCHAQPTGLARSTQQLRSRVNSGEHSGKQ